MGTSDQSMAAGSVDKKTLSREDQTKSGMNWILCDPAIPREGAGKDSTSTVHGSQELEVT